MNKAAVKILGFTRQEWKKMTAHDILGKKEISKKKQFYKAILRTKKNRNLNTSISLNPFSRSGKQYVLMVMQQENVSMEGDPYVYPDKLLGQSVEQLKRVIQFAGSSQDIQKTAQDITLSPELLNVLGIESDVSVIIPLQHADNKHIEEKLKQSVKEKEMLIREIHHRVKNNLQIISSIIYLKMISLEQSDIRSFLENTRQKIKSIALIHERLLQSEKLDEVEIADYLGKLLIDIQVSHYREDLEIIIKKEVEEGLLPLDTAIYCGLIVNELVTNSIKHAFQNRRQGIVHIFLKRDENKYMLEVRDNGITLPEHIIPGKANSFGLQMLDVFVKQLNGSWRILRQDGTAFLIRF